MICCVLPLGMRANPAEAAIATGDDEFVPFDPAHPMAAIPSVIAAAPASNLRFMPPSSILEFSVVRVREGSLCHTRLGPSFGSHLGGRDQAASAIPQFGRMSRPGSPINAIGAVKGGSRTAGPKRRRVTFGKVVLWLFLWPFRLYWWLLVLGWRLLKTVVRAVFGGAAAILRAPFHWRIRSSRRAMRRYGSDLAAIDRMGGYDFEARLGALFGALGYGVEPTKLSGDKGADLVVTRNGERIVIQAKCYGPDRRVSVDAIQEAVTAIRPYRAHRAAVVTNRAFTSQAIELAEDNGVRLWDRSFLEQALAAEQLANTSRPVL